MGLVLLAVPPAVLLNARLLADELLLDVAVMPPVEAGPPPLPCANAEPHQIARASPAKVPRITKPTRVVCLMATPSFFWVDDAVSTKIGLVPRTTSLQSLCLRLLFIPSLTLTSENPMRNGAI